MEPIRFAQICDTHLGMNNDEAVMMGPVFEKLPNTADALTAALKQLAAQNLDFVLFCGDLVHEGRNARGGGASGVAGRCGPSGVSAAEGASRSSSFPMRVSSPRPRAAGRALPSFAFMAASFCLACPSARHLTLRARRRSGRARGVGEASRSCNVRLESVCSDRGRN